MKIVSELWDYPADLRYLGLLHESPGNKEVCDISQQSYFQMGKNEYSYFHMGGPATDLCNPKD